MSRRVVHERLLEDALAGEDRAVRDLVETLTPVIQARVARTLLARGQRRARALLEDLVQEIFLTLLEDDGRVLRSWEPERGMSLENFVGLVATRRTVSYLRSGRRVGWRENPTLDDEDADGPVGPVPVTDDPGPEERVESRDTLRRLLDRMREDLSPQGWQLFDLLYVRERSVERVCAETGLSADAVYAWRSRLRRHARRVLDRMSETAGSPRIQTGEGTR